MLSAPKEDTAEPEQGIRKPRSGLPEPSRAYRAGTWSAECLLRILDTGFATTGALHQALHEVMERGQPETLRGFTDALQERLGGRHDGHDATA